MSEAAVDEKADVAAGFAAMMSQAHDQAAGEEPEAPYGWTTDRDGSRRPKKSPGRPRKSPSLDELKAGREAAADAGAPEPPPQDRAPAAGRRGPGRRRDRPGPPAPQFREGVIAKGINRLYRRAGKLIAVMDADVGQALVDITRKVDDDDVTVGDAWEELARGNPRIRAFLMRMIAGGAWGQVFAAHAPVLLVILMKDAVRRRIPFGGLMEAFLTPDTEQGGDGTAPAQGTPFEGLTPGDVQEIFATAQQFAEQMTRAPGGTLRPPVPGPAGTTAGPAASGN